MSNRNLTNLAMLYDLAANQLDKVLKSGMPHSDGRVIKALNMLHESAKTMSLVYQIENLRRTQSEEKVDLPEEKVVEEEAKKPSNPAGFPDQGWTPF